METLARRMWRLLETYHAVVYFSPELRVETDAAGLRGGWMGYFAARAAPMGAVPAGVVVATFYNFHPAMVERAIPDAWSFSTPERVLAARLAGVDAALRRSLGDGVGGKYVTEGAELARVAAEAARPEGRPLFAANAGLAWPEPPHLALWHAATLLREHRGDGHVAALTAAGIDGVEAHWLLIAAGRSSAESIRPARGWPDEEWDAAGERLRSRGWIDAADALTAAGLAVVEDVDKRTDETARPPYEVLGDAGCRTLEMAMHRLAKTILNANALAFGFPNPMGLPRS